MKHLILAVALAAISATGFSQTKKPDSTKKITNTVPATVPLKQEIIWPVNNPDPLNRENAVIKPRSAVKTRIRL